MTSGSRKNLVLLCICAAFMYTKCPSAWIPIWGSQPCKNLRNEQGIARIPRRQAAGNSGLRGLDLLGPISTEKNLNIIPNPDKSPKKYKKLIEELISQLLEFTGLPKNGGSMFPKKLIQLGSKFHLQQPWTNEDHYVFFTRANELEPLAWSIIKERKEDWYVKYVWVNPKYRKNGLGRLILSYIESAIQYPTSRGWETPDELKLLSGGVDEFYDKLGYSRCHAGSIYIRDDPRTHHDSAATHQKWMEGKPDPRWVPYIAIAGQCQNGRNADEHFHTHVVPVPF